MNPSIGFGDAGFAAALKAWFECMPGSLVSDVERVLLARALPDLFGYHILQLGCHHQDGLLAASRITHQVLIDLGHTLNPSAHMH